MGSVVRPVKVFDSVPDRILICIIALALQAFLCSKAHAQEQIRAPDGNESEVTSVETDGSLQAFQRPSRDSVAKAETQLYFVLGIALAGIILLFLGTAVYYQRPHWEQPYKPTEVIRAPGVEPRPRSTTKERVRYTLSDE